MRCPLNALIRCILSATRAISKMLYGSVAMLLSNIHHCGKCLTVLTLGANRCIIPYANMVSRSSGSTTSCTAFACCLFPTKTPSNQSKRRSCTWKRKCISWNRNQITFYGNGSPIRSKVFFLQCLPFSGLVRMVRGRRFTDPLISEHSSLSGRVIG